MATNDSEENTAVIFFTLKMEAVCSSEALEVIYQVARCDELEDSVSNLSVV
jgi:hypothetical protein